MPTSDFLREAESLRRLASKEEREAIRRQDLRETFSEFHELNDQLHLRLRADIMKVQQQLQKLKNGVFRFQQQLMDTKPSPDVVDRLRDTMTDIETSINMFKDTQHRSFEELLKDERIVWQEISVLERKTEAWRVPVRAEVRVPGAGPARRSADTHRSVPAELLALDSFLQRTGSRGGWDELDHRSFLSVWTKHSGKHSFIREAGLYLPGKSEEDLKQHELWFLELRRLQEKKREAVQRWREAKQRERDQQRDQQDRAGAEPDQEQEQERLKLKQEQRRREASERLENWRSRRTQEREQEQEQRLRNQILQRRRAKEEQRRQLEVKLRVEALVQQKKEEEDQRLMEEEEKRRAEREERQRGANEAIRRFQDRDSVRLEEKLQEKQSKEQERWERQQTLEKLKEKVEVSHDPSRLWRRTEVWEQRMRNIGPSGSGPAPLLHTCHRAVPAWRQDS
ncbi:coiled-coil domain-containing protein 112 [Siphateles boraxobius]|uniref:coiled-coil domain-containing protein 112 n=1 Tax=Siphateles boraxobius TaxID=180520 RepID=UPI0040642C26